MTAPSPVASAGLPLPARLPLAARLPLVGLYPAKYRAAYGEEIAAVFAEVTEHASPGTALCEWAHLAAHALRLRTRLSSSDPAGRIAAGAAPFILAGGAGLSMAYLPFELLLPNPLPPGPWVHSSLRTALVATQTGPWVLALLFACIGRWRPARLLFLLGILGWVGSVLAFTPQFWLAVILPFLLLLPYGLVPGTLLLIAPPDAVDLSPRGRKEIALTALAIAVPMSALAICCPWQSDPSDTSDPFAISAMDLLDASTAWPAAVMSLALFLHLGARRPDRLRAAGIALAVLPWTAMLFPPELVNFAPPYGPAPVDFSDDLLRNAGVVLAFLATATLLALLRHARRRSRPIDPPGLA